jgi:hypothetical protein
MSDDLDVMNIRLYNVLCRNGVPQSLCMKVCYLAINTRERDPAGWSLWSGTRLRGKGFTDEEIEIVFKALTPTFHANFGKGCGVVSVSPHPTHSITQAVYCAHGTNEGINLGANHVSDLQSSTARRKCLQPL